MIRLLIMSLTAGFAAVCLAGGGCSGAENGGPSPMPASPAPSSAGPAPGRDGEEPAAATQTATFGAGCFWGVESTFRKVPGVVRTRAGYAGGTTERPTYEEVCADQSGHAEVVQVEYAPTQVTYQVLLATFFENHDPTTLNRQGPDVGGQYRSVVFFHSPEQEQLARAEKERRDQSGEYVGPLVTAVQPAPPFWPAEEYHQQYFQKAGVDWTCHTGNGKKPKVSVTDPAGDARTLGQANGLTNVGGAGVVVWMGRLTAARG